MLQNSHAQAIEASNIKHTLYTDRIEVIYDLPATTDSIDVELFFLQKENPNFSFIPQYTTGNIGKGIYNTKNKITWWYKDEYNKKILDSKGYYFDITARYIKKQAELPIIAPSKPEPTTDLASIDNDKEDPITESADYWSDSHPTKIHYSYDTIEPSVTQDAEGDYNIDFYDSYILNEANSNLKINLIALPQVIYFNNSNLNKSSNEYTVLDSSLLKFLILLKNQKLITCQILNVEKGQTLNILLSTTGLQLLKSKSDKVYYLNLGKSNYEVSTKSIQSNGIAYAEIKDNINLNNFGNLLNDNKIIDINKEHKIKFISKNKLYKLDKTFNQSLFSALNTKIFQSEETKQTLINYSIELQNLFGS